jgi:hypothetical protein
MRAIEANTFSGYGGLRQTELPKPQSAKDRVLVRVTAAGVTPLEYTVLSGGHPRAKAPLGPIRDRHGLEVASERYTDVSLREASEGRVFEQKCVVGDAHDLLRRFQSP